MTALERNGKVWVLWYDEQQHDFSFRCFEVAVFETEKEARKAKDVFDHDGGEFFLASVPEHW